VTLNDELLCWGASGFGVLGTGDEYAPIFRPTPAAMPAVLGSAALGYDDHACAVTTHGRIFCWGGYNFFGELGLGVFGGIQGAAQLHPVPAPIVAADSARP
jgi:alpha-tubulin suppressor-like RCC1 family protein